VSWVTWLPTQAGSRTEDIEIPFLANDQTPKVARLRRRLTEPRMGMAEDNPIDCDEAQNESTGPDRRPRCPPGHIWFDKTANRRCHAASG
jgi:hypothetical protein